MMINCAINALVSVAAGSAVGGFFAMKPLYGAYRGFIAGTIALVASEIFGSAIFYPTFALVPVAFFFAKKVGLIDDFQFLKRTEEIILNNLDVDWLDRKISSLANHTLSENLFPRRVEKFLCEFLCFFSNKVNFEIENEEILKCEERCVERS